MITIKSLLSINSMSMSRCIPARTQPAWNYTDWLAMWWHYIKIGTLLFNIPTITTLKLCLATLHKRRLYVFKSFHIIWRSLFKCVYIYTFSFYRWFMVSLCHVLHLEAWHWGILYHILVTLWTIYWKFWLWNEYFLLKYIWYRQFPHGLHSNFILRWWFIGQLSRLFIDLFFNFIYLLVAIFANIASISVQVYWWELWLFNKYILLWRIKAKKILNLLLIFYREFICCIFTTVIYWFRNNVVCLLSFVEIWRVFVYFPAFGFASHIFRWHWVFRSRIWINWYLA